MAHFGPTTLLAVDLSHLEVTLKDRVMALQPRNHRWAGTSHAGEKFLETSKFLETRVSKAPDTFSVAQGLPKSEVPGGR